MSGEIIQRTDLTQYGLGPDYSTITIGDLNLYATKVDFHFDGGPSTMLTNQPEYVTMTVEYRGAQDDIRGNLLMTSGGFSTEQAVMQMKHTLDAYLKGNQ